MEWIRENIGLLIFLGAVVCIVYSLYSIGSILRYSKEGEPKEKFKKVFDIFWGIIRKQFLISLLVVLVGSSVVYQVLGIFDAVGFLIGALVFWFILLFQTTIQSKSLYQITEGYLVSIDLGKSIAGSLGAVGGFLNQGILLILLYGYFLYSGDINTFLLVTLGVFIASFFSKFYWIFFEETISVERLQSVFKKKEDTKKEKDLYLISSVANVLVDVVIKKSTNSFEISLITLVVAVFASASFFGREFNSTEYILASFSTGLSVSVVSTFLTGFWKKSVFKKISYLIGAGATIVLNYLIAGVFLLGKGSYWMESVMVANVISFVFFGLLYLTSRLNIKIILTKQLLMMNEIDKRLVVLVAGGMRTFLTLLLFTTVLFLEIYFTGWIGVIILLINLSIYIGLLTKSAIDESLSLIACKTSNYLDIPIKITKRLKNIQNSEVKFYQIFIVILIGVLLLNSVYDFSQRVGTGFSFNILDPLILTGMFLGVLVVLIFNTLILGAGLYLNLAVLESAKKFVSKKEGVDFIKISNFFRLRIYKYSVFPLLLSIVVPVGLGLVLGSLVIVGLLVGMMLVFLMISLERISKEIYSISYGLREELNLHNDLMVGFFIQMVIITSMILARLYSS